MRAVASWPWPLTANTFFAKFMPHFFSAPTGGKGLSKLTFSRFAGSACQGSFLNRWRGVLLGGRLALGSCTSREAVVIISPLVNDAR